VAAANELPTDEPRRAYAHRREVALGELAGGVRPGFSALPLPPELAGSAEASYHDLRLVRSDGREIPYLLEITSEQLEVHSDSGQLVEVRTDSGRSSWLVDLLAQRSFDTLELEVAQDRFAKRVTIEGARERSGPFATLRTSAAIFDRPWLKSPTFWVRHTTIEWDVAQNARYLRVTVDDSQSRPIELRGVVALHHRATPAQMWTRPAPLVELAAGPRPSRHAAAPTHSRYRLQLPAGLPVEQLVLRADELALVRPVRLLELLPASPSGEGAANERELASDTLYRLVAAKAPAPPSSGKHRGDDESRIDSQLQAEWMTLRLSQAPGGGTLVLEIDNGDSPPLSGLRAEAYGCGARLIFEDRENPASATPKWTLYYGNPAARAPHYDLEALRERLTHLGPLRPARLLPQENNPRYQPAPPLSFVNALGAPLQQDHFRLARALKVSGGPDIYAVTLGPVEVGLLRPDLGDIRIVDAQNRQVPYVLAADAGETHVELSRSAEPRPRLSRYRLSYSAPGDAQPLALPLLAVELGIRDTFYSRTVRLLEAAPDGRSDNLLYAGTLQRQGDDAALLHSLPLWGNRLRELVLQIEDQDNAPLTIERASGVLRAPRLAFKLTPGEGYRLLLGDPDTAPPQYDIETLRQAVLAYAALPAELGPLYPNRAYRARTNDYLLHAPPTALLWGSLLLAVVVLLAITVRLLGKTPPPE
jgi:hypothetical protein